MGKGESVDKVGTNLSAHAQISFFLSYKRFLISVWRETEEFLLHGEHPGDQQHRGGAQRQAGVGQGGRGVQSSEWHHARYLGISGVPVWLWVLLTSDPPPGDQEAFLVVRNHAGNHGTLSYSLGTARLLLNVMWTSGMNCDHYANTVGVGVTSSPNTDKFKSGSQCRLCHLSCWTVLVQCFSSGSPGLRSRTSCSAQTRWCSGRTGSSSPRWWSSSLRLTSSSQWRTSRRNKQSHLVWLCSYNYV